MYIHFLEIDRDHYGNAETIYQHKGDFKSFNKYIEETYIGFSFQNIKLNEDTKFYAIEGNISILCWKGEYNMEEKKYYSHMVRYKTPKTIKEQEDFIFNIKL